jgi:hypothetical protein
MLHVNTERLPVLADAALPIAWLHCIISAAVLTLPEHPRGVPMVRISQSRAPSVTQPSQVCMRGVGRTSTVHWEW